MGMCDPEVNLFVRWNVYSLYLMVDWNFFSFGILVYWIYYVDSAMQKNKSYFTHSHQSVLIMWRISFLWHAFQMEFYRFDCRFIGTVIVSTSTNTSQFVIRVNVFGFFLPRIWIFLPRGPIFMNVCRLVFSISKLLH